MITPTRASAPDPEGSTLSTSGRGRSRRIPFGYERQALGATLFIFLLGFASLVLPLGKPLRWLSYDLAFPFRPAAPASDLAQEVAIVYMDDQSHLQLRQPDLSRWDRRLHARLLDRLKAGSARAVVFDILFDSPGSPDEDRALAEAAQAFQGKVAFAAKLGAHLVQGEPVATRALAPIELLRPLGVWGFVELGGEDKFVREHFRSTPEYPSLSSKVLEIASGQPFRSRDTHRWINYYGPPGFLPSYSFHEVLDGTVPPSTFSNRVVFVGAHFGVGYSGGRGTDDFRTPFSRWTGLRAPGVEINATTYLNLQRADWLIELSPWKELGLLLLAAIALGAGLATSPPLIAMAAGLVSALLLAVTAILAVWKTGVWSPFLIVAAVQVPAAIGWSVFSHTQRLRRENQALQERLVSPPQPLPTNQRVADSTTAEATPVPDHKLIRQIGAGAYGEVWLARDAIGTFHAVKIIHRSRFKTPEPFDREFRGIQKFTPISRMHPNWVQILHVGRNDLQGYFYYVMELGDDRLAGAQIDPATYSPKNLAKELEHRRKLAVSECLPMALALTSALDFLHQHGLIHRDIKPSNIIFVNGVPKFADIGLITTLADQSADHSYVGTEGYIPPEGPGTALGDIYSLGKVIYEASMGLDRKQFPALPNTLAEREDIAALLALNKIILKACEADPARRYPSAAAMQRDLLELRRGFSSG